jgi:hypothetical protein
MRQVSVAGLLIAALVVAPSSVVAAAKGSPSRPSGNLPSCLTAPKPSQLLTATQLKTLLPKITAAVKGNMQSVAACTGGPIFVRLLPGREWLAQQLTTTYSTKVSFDVGLTHWNGRPGKSETCGDLAKSRHLPADLTATFIPNSMSVTSGSTFRGSVRFTNRGSSDITATSGTSLTAYVVDHGTRRVIGVSTLFTGLMGHFHIVKPGHSVLVPATGGTALCDRGIGSAVPPGNYDVVVQGSLDPLPLVRGGRAEYLTPPVPIRVTTYHHPKG